MNGAATEALRAMQNWEERDPELQRGLGQSWVCTNPSGRDWGMVLGRTPLRPRQGLRLRVALPCLRPSFEPAGNSGASAA